jgi:hypothetical protein
MNIETAHKIETLLKDLKVYEIQLDELSYLEAKETKIQFTQDTIECEMIIDTKIDNNIDLINCLIESAKDFLSKEIANIKREISNL